MVLMIDNYDSFTYNLFQLISELGASVSVHRNDCITTDQVLENNYGSIIISPGPGGPKDAGISIELVQQNRGRTPILGVCLGHQVIAEAFGGNIILSPRLMHGKTSQVYHDGKSIFAGLPNPFRVVRYHSLAVDKYSLPACIEVSAWTADGEIMAIRHKDLPVEGVQFHPESLLTEHGGDLLQNWLRMARKAR
ncbi:MAG: aminodeoxychorismate/anthranilate synthase component II [Firmicutes bacterium]|nr:aminodeoxychorismate/anthranilate synthase component II [Bacillota bacterium]